MVEKKNCLIFIVAVIVAIISTVIAVYMTINIPKPETQEVFIKMFLENTSIYMQTFFATLVSTGACIGVIASGTHIFINYFKEDYYMDSDIIQLEKKHLIIIGSLIGVALFALIGYIIRYLILLFIIPGILLFLGKETLDSK